MWDFFVIHCASDKTRAFLEILHLAIGPSGLIWHILELYRFSAPAGRTARIDKYLRNKIQRMTGKKGEELNIFKRSRSIWCQPLRQVWRYG